ncbi:class I SAM-dependent methyltransferase [Variovorax sp. PCZ-1]|uniref:class I SAM-dependent methyltransferase n=1 Tax=Variovorax sp. PCZ-1 TaxID=2835533 RepID=UPI001BCD8360|nr:class I SAM-dependent methyltransferase [Variovorax sp. PCZ-1]MBS7808577.1 class I SAM-dependent methyltransferase [Variovorax sp. PCZ-1]
MTDRSSPEQISREILLRSEQIQAKDGSQGLDALASLHQYHLAYTTANRLLPEAANVLDWGGGSGHFSFFLNRSGFHTNIYTFSEPQFICTEISNGQINCCIAEPNQPVLLPYPDNFFDAVFSIGVLEHVRETGGDERASLSEIHRILKPNGVFLCYHFPSSGSWIEWLAAKLGRYHHQHTYNHAQVQKIYDGIFLISELQRYAVLPRNMLRRLPKSIANHSWFCRLFNFVDKVLAKCLPWVTQNWMIVARKVQVDGNP